MAETQPAVGAVRLLRPRAACAKLGVGRTKLKELSKHDPSFPRKIVLGPKSIAYVETELDAWIANQREPVAA